MTSIILTLTGAEAQASVSGPLTSGMVGIPITIQYDDSWKGLIKNLVCRCGQWGPEQGETRTILNVGETAAVAHEVMQADRSLYLAVEGYNADGTLVMPTTWADCGMIQHGASVEADPADDPELSVWNQLQAEMEQIKDNTLSREQVDAIQAWTQEASQAAASAAAAAQRAENVSCLPQCSEADNGKVLGIVDGSPAWVEIDASGGEPTPPPVTAYGVVWDLVNVTSSNSAVTVDEGAALTAVLTPAEGYTLGDVVITMGGEVLTGAWNADTATVTIASVTGDVVISCVGVAEAPAEPADTAPVIAAADSAINYNTKEIVSAVGMSVTKAYEYSWDIDELKAHAQYDAANDYLKTSGYQGGIRIYTPSTNFVAGGGTVNSTVTSWGAYCGTRVSADGVPTEGVNMKSAMENNTERMLQITAKRADYLNAGKLGFEFTMFTADIENSYAYWYKPYGTSVLPEGVEAGDIIFAGSNTAYYGMKNIDGTMLANAEVLTVDADYAQDYGMAVASVLGEDPMPGADVYAGVSDEFAAVINTAKKEWMTACGGDYRKIPLIVSTDHHGRTSGVFNLLGRILSMQDVSKICDLGDTVTETWIDADPEHPLLKCEELEQWQKCLEKIPFSKRLSVIGNHDAGTASGIPTDSAHLDQYFRNIYARRTNNNGWFAVKDDRWNVKYVVVTGLENVGGSHGNITTAQMKWIISELSADDGYDIVIVSHIPLKWTTETGGISRVSDLDTDAFFAARKTGGSGTITDSEGVSHTYDFSSCATELLCSLHGHTHANQHLYLEDALLVKAFAWFPGERFFLVLIDRVERQLNIWEIDNTPTYTNYQISLDQTGA